MAVGDVARNTAAQQALALFTQDGLFTEHQHFACYLARREEFDCSPIIKALWQANKACYLPVLSTEQSGQLNFVRYQENDAVHLNRLRILEPNDGETIDPQKLDVVLLPLVGFDLEGNRLGMGGGYYDKTFSFIRNHIGIKPILIGLAYELQQVHELPHDEWDVKLSGILTEKRIIPVMPACF